MPTHDFKDIGDVLAFDVLKGTIASIDSANDTCMVSVGGTILDALLFYHCKPDSVMRDNGAIEGAAAGFSVGDEVIVLRRFDDSVIKVIGHTDGIRSCGVEFHFYLTCHGSAITDVSDDYIYFDICNSDGNTIGYYYGYGDYEYSYGITVTYDPDKGYWALKIDNEDDYDPNGYFVSYESDYGICTQYPHKYKTADLQLEADLIQPGTYTDNLPYFNYTITYSKQKEHLAGPGYDLGYFYMDVYNDPLIVTINVDSELPYQIASSCSCSFDNPSVTSWNVASQYDAWNGLIWDYLGTATYTDQLGGTHTLYSGPIFSTIFVTGGSSGASLSIAADAPPPGYGEPTGNVAVSANVSVQITPDFD
jgi:hypothetical protein